METAESLNIETNLFTPMASKFIIKCDNVNCGAVFKSGDMVGTCPKCGFLSGGPKV